MSVLSGFQDTPSIFFFKCHLNLDSGGIMTLLEKKHLSVFILQHSSPTPSIVFYIFGARPLQTFQTASAKVVAVPFFTCVPPLLSHLGLRRAAPPSTSVAAGFTFPPCSLAKQVILRYEALRITVSSQPISETCYYLNYLLIVCVCAHARVCPQRLS